eukprot:GHVU01122423.1.p1 GENE.GHVU01122423.1~~GHVU01122423.1.p1  ORF type:complete len:255 (+),score=63.03 GHVU01122423.1:256-1020(+)
MQIWNVKANKLVYELKSVCLVGKREGPTTTKGEGTPLGGGGSRQRRGTGSGSRADVVRVPRPDMDRKLTVREVLDVPEEEEEEDDDAEEEEDEEEDDDGEEEDTVDKDTTEHASSSRRRRRLASHIDNDDDDESNRPQVRVTAFAAGAHPDVVGVGCSDGRVMVVDVRCDAVLYTFQHEPDRDGGVTSLAFQSCPTAGVPRLVSATEKGCIASWDLQRGTFEFAVPRAHRRRVTAVAFLPGETVFASSGRFVSE